MAFEKEMNKSDVFAKEMSIMIDILDTPMSADERVKLNARVSELIKLRSYDLQQNDYAIANSIKNERLKLVANCLIAVFSIAGFTTAFILSPDNSALKGGLLFAIGAVLPILTTVIFKKWI